MTVVDPESMDSRVPLDRLAKLHTLLARCFAHPDEDTSATIRSGRIVDRIEDQAAVLGVEVDRPDVPSQPHEAYLRTFEGFDGGGHAPPAESVYKPWWDGTDRGLLSGPPAHDMARRYEAVDIDTPEAYPADHIALELEYASLLLEAGAEEAYVAFADTHFEWLPTLRERVERTTDVAFHMWAARTLETVVNRTVSTVDGQATEAGESG